MRSSECETGLLVLKTNLGQEWRQNRAKKTKLNRIDNKDIDVVYTMFLKLSVDVSGKNKRIYKIWTSQFFFHGDRTRLKKWLYGKWQEMKNTS